MSADPITTVNGKINASKEQANKALDLIVKLQSNHQAMTVVDIQYALASVAQFIEVAHRKLPKEAAFQRERDRKLKYNKSGVSVPPPMLH